MEIYSFREVKLNNNPSPKNFFNYILPILTVIFF